MILAKGRLWDSGRQDEILLGLEAYINRIRATKRLRRETRTGWRRSARSKGF